MAITDWTVKNERRKDAKKNGSFIYQQGRYNRRTLATNGAFGDLPARLYNECVKGTTANEKREKKEKQTYEDKADYDS